MPRILDKFKQSIGHGRGKPVLSSQPQHGSGDEEALSSLAQPAPVNAPNDLDPDQSTNPQPSASCWDIALENLKQEHIKTYEKLLQSRESAQGALSPGSIAASADEQAHRLKEKDWRLRTALKRAAKAMGILEKTVMSAARLEPHGGATLACAGIFAIMQPVINDTKQYEFALNSVVEISPIIERWTLHEKRILAYDQFSSSGKSQNLRARLIELYVEIMIHVAEMASYCQQSHLRRFTAAIAPRLDEWKIQLDLVKTKDGICKSYRDNQDTERNFQKQNSDLLQWISTTDSSFEHQNVLDVTKVGSDYSLCGQWLLDSTEYCGWRDGQGSRILWLRGTVGTGKTTLMARIIQNLRDFPTKRTRLAFHYCSKAQSGGGRIDQVSVLKSILRQMAWVPEDSSIASPIVGIYERLKLSRPKEGNLSVEDCVRLIRDIISSAQKLYSASFRLIVDALDECEEPEELLESLFRATEACDNVFWMISSRLNVQVPERIPAVIQVHTEAARSSEDMNVFVRNEIERKRKRLPGIDPSNLEDRLTTLLREKANGMFRWTQMQLQDFFLTSASRPRLRTQTEVNDKLRSLDKRTGVTNLDQEYERVYSENTTPGSESREHAEKAFKLLLCCFEPLSLDQLVVASSVKEDSTLYPEVCGSYILDICSNFIVVNHNVVQFAHPSAREYLESRKSGGIEEFAVEAQHVQAALSCLAILRRGSGGLRKRTWTLKDFKPDADYGRVLESLPAESRYPFYASCFWAPHAAEASTAGRRTDSVSPRIAQFLSSAAFRDWHILMGEISQYYNYYTRRGGQEIFCSFVSFDESSLPELPNPIFLISAFGFVECLEEPDIARRISGHGMNHNGDTPLYLACYFGRTEIMEKFLGLFGEHFDANGKGGKGLTLLEKIILLGKNTIEIMSILLRHGLVKRISFTDSAAALACAVARERLEAVDMMVQHMQEEHTHQQMLMLMLQPPWCFFRQALTCDVICEFLLRKFGPAIASGALEYKPGDSLLGEMIVEASARGAFGSLQMLVSLNVSVNTSDSEGRTTLHVARTCEIAEYLLRQDPSLLRARDGDGQTPLLTAFFNSKENLWQVLLAHGGNVQDCNNDGQTALHLAAKGDGDGCATTAEFLIEQGLASIRDHRDNTALHLLNLTHMRFDPERHLLMLRLLEGGQALLAANTKGVTAAELVWGHLHRQTSFMWLYTLHARCQPVYCKIIIYFMEELRRKEKAQLLGNEQLDVLYFLCHRLRDESKYEDGRAEEIIREGGLQQDEIVLDILARQRECGWKLPMYKKKYLYD